MSRLSGMVLDVGRLRQYRDLRLLMIGQLISGMGRQITLVALPYQLYLLTHNPLAIGALAVVQLIPLLAFSLFGGAIADAMERRRLLLVTQTLLLFCSLALAAVATLAEPPLIAIYALALVATSITAIDQPARSAAVYRQVPRSDLGWAISMSQASFQLSSVFGPVIGGVVIAILGLPAAYFTDAVTFLASIAALLAIAPMPPVGEARRASLAAVREGLSYARRNRVILATFVIDLDAMIFGLPVALFPILALDVFHTGAAGVGLMTAAPAFGALVGALLTGWVHRVRRQGVAVIIAVLIWGLAITAFGLSSFSFAVALVFLAIAGAADMFSAIFRGTILQTGVPDALRGRLSSLHLMVVTGGPRVGDIESTAVAAAIGAQLSVITGGLLCVFGLLFVTAWFPELARYDAHAAAAAAAAADAEDEAAAVETASVSA